MRKRILLAPLDWGLGHSSRCVALARRLEALGCEVLLAGNAVQKAYFSTTLPHLPVLPLEGYNVTYSRSRLGFLPHLLAQWPRLRRVLQEERRWVRKIAAEWSLDGIISDNRYGLWHPELPCVVLTHQLEIQTGLGTAANLLLRRHHYQLLQAFDACWIPDTPAAPGLGHRLSHPGKLPPSTRYLGWLSQFDGLEQPVAAGERIRLLLLLSGPEPQRSMLADTLWQQAREVNGPVVLVEGIPNAPCRHSEKPDLHQVSMSGGAELLSLLLRAEMVMCRSGYSSLMDLATMQKKAVLIPTPGQTEQEYLARTLHARGCFLSRPQTGFSLQEALQAADDFPYDRSSLEAPRSGEDPVAAWVNSL